LGTRAPHPAKADYRLRSPQPRNYRQHGALEYKSATRKQACALCLQRPSPPLRAIGAIDAARESANDTDAPARIASSQGIAQTKRKIMASAKLFQKLQLRKKRTQLPLSKNPCSGSQASGKLSTACRMKILLRASLAGDRTAT